MADRRESNSPADCDQSSANEIPWQELAPFRETFLQYITAEETREALLHLGDIAFQMVLEYRVLWPPREEGYVEAGLRAAARDLEYLATYLRLSIAAADSASSLTKRESLLARKTLRWSKQIAAVTSEINSALEV